MIVSAGAQQGVGWNVQLTDFAALQTGVIFVGWLTNRYSAIPCNDTETLYLVTIPKWGY